jgi:carbonic anhydrase
MDTWPTFPDATAAPLPRSRPAGNDAGGSSAGPRTAAPADGAVLAPTAAMARLRAGNARFAANRTRHGPAGPPFVAVLGCLDPRVPVESAFDEGAGTVVAVRSAGHVLDRSILGSVEFAVTDLLVSLVVVLGHDGCRAVAAATAAAAVRDRHRPGGAVRYVLDEIAPAVRDLGGTDDVDAVTRQHVRRTVARVRSLDRVASAERAKRVRVVGGVYHLDSGVVEFL